MNKIKECIEELGHDCTVNFDPKGEQTLDGRNLPVIEFNIISPSQHPLSDIHSAKISFYATVQKKVGIDKLIIRGIFKEESSEFVNLSKITRDFVNGEITRLIKESHGKNWENN